LALRWGGLEVNESAYQVLLRGGRVVDPASGVDMTADVAISDGRVIAIGEGLASERADRAVDVRGKLVVPGLIDLHTHVYPGGMPSAIVSDLAGVLSGVTTVVDAGSAGPATIRGLLDVVASARTRIVPFLNAARTGLATHPEVREPEDIDLEAMREVLARHHEVIRGVKLRAIGPGLGRMGAVAVQRVHEVAREAGVPMMVHIGEREALPTGPLTADLLPLLTPGDVVTHVATSQVGGLVTAGGEILPQAKEAYAAGVIFDLGTGVANLGFRQLEALLTAGLIPHTLSTDMAVRPRQGPTFSLVETMAKMMALGLSLLDVIKMVTDAPASVLRRTDLGRIVEGGHADITVLSQVSGTWEFADSVGDVIPGSTALVPVLTVKSGNLISPDWGPHPWGWLPKGEMHEETGSIDSGKEAVWRS
jgi:dihydroorotase